MSETREPTGAGHDPSGLRQKYNVRRTDGRDQPGQPHEGCFLFVLDIDHDPAALAALRYYAEQVEASRPQLAIDLTNVWAERLMDNGPQVETVSGARLLRSTWREVP